MEDQMPKYNAADYDEDSEWFAQCLCGNRYGGVGGPPHRCPECGRMPGA